VCLLAQIVAASILVYLVDLKVTQVVSPVSGEVMQLGAYAEIFTMLLVLTAINAFNIFEGATASRAAKHVWQLGGAGRCLLPGIRQRLDREASPVAAHR
jgi:hypothetical protein